MNLKSLFSFLITFELLFATLNISVFSWEGEEWEPKQYSNATIDEDFCSSSVLVVMDKKVGGLNKVHELSFFGDFPIEEIVDLTASKFDPKDYRDDVDPYYRPPTWRQILVIKLSFSSKQNVLNVISILEKIDGVRSAEPSYYHYTSSPPNDPIYATGDQWALEKINTQGAWGIATGGLNVRVGVIDSGIADHVDFRINPNDPNSSIVDRTLGCDFIGRVQQTFSTINPTNNHGTAVAGIIGAVGNNNAGITGICWQVNLIPFKVGDLTFNIWSVIAAIDYARDSYLTNTPIQILNYSGGGSNNPALRQAIINYPGLLVTGAGNTGYDNDQIPFYPASYDLPNIIVAGASNQSDTRWIKSNSQSSNYGSTSVHLFAPGVDIYTTNFNDTYSPNFSATSAAAPHVAGVAALLLSAYPNATTAQIKQAILDGVDEIPALSDLCITGGRLNAHKALAAMQGSVEIKGTQYSTGLTSLDLSGMALTHSDMEELRYMANLQYLNLESNQLFDEDLYPLKGLLELEILNLANNIITDITHLSGLTKLKTLSLSANQISDLTPLKGLTELTFLALDENQISNLWTLSYLTKLKYLYLASNQINDLHPLNALDYLEVLNLWDNQITDSSVSWLCHMSTLKWLCLGGNNITNPMPLTALRGNLEWLDLGVNPISLTIITQLRASLPNCAIYF